MRVSWLNLHLLIPQKDVRKLIYRKLDRLDRLMVIEAHRCRNKYGSWIISEIAEKGYLGLLEWWLNTDVTYACPHDIWLITQPAAKAGHLYILEWLDKCGKLRDHDNICQYAAEGGHLHIIVWAQLKGFLCDHRTATNAAYSGHLHVLEWLIENGYDIDKVNCLRGAKINGHKDVIEWLKLIPD